MRSLKRFALVVWLALALVAGQHEALRHDLGHAADSLSHKQDKPGSTKCEKCFAAVPLAGAPSTGLSVPAVDCDAAVSVVVESGAPLARALAYRAQAPPVLL